MKDVHENQIQENYQLENTDTQPAANTEPWDHEKALQFLCEIYLTQQSNRRKFY